MIRKRSTAFIILFIVFIMAAAAVCFAAPSEAEDGSGEYKTLDELNGKRIGIMTGDVYDVMVIERLPDAEIKYYNSMPDLVAALESDKVDGICGGDLYFKELLIKDDGLALIDEPVTTCDLAFVFQKGKNQKLKSEINSFIYELEQAGEIEEIVERWTGKDDSVKTVEDYSSLPDENGTVKFVTEASNAPLNYYKGNQVVGIEIELITRFCKEHGYALDMSDMDFAALIPAIQAGKYDIVSSGIAVTEERAKIVDFSVPYLAENVMMAVRSKATKRGSMFSHTIESFRSTFLVEGRYNLFILGIVRTLNISLLSLIFGTLLGFLVYMICRRFGRITTLVTDASVWLIESMPAVVLLMVMYYIIFGKFYIEGVWIAILCFTLIFGASVYNLLKEGADSISTGQTEAGYALGFNDSETFFGVIFPQAARRIMPDYRAAVVSLMQATAIVGYVAIDDLTKMGDIVRSRTYQAFFPLMAVTVIYLILAGLINYITKKLAVRLDPKTRTKEQILKGVKTDD